MRVIDSHTEGEPTRTIIEGAPELGTGSMAERASRFAKEFDDVRRFSVLEPRGHNAVVGAMLCKPVDPKNAAGVIFFNNVGNLGMCGHGTIGVAVTMAHLGRIGEGQHTFETPVGDVAVNLISRNEVEIQNVPSYRFRKDVLVNVPSIGPVIGDIAWGGNWFFLVSQSPVEIRLANLQQLLQASQAVSDALASAGIRGKDGAPIDHIEFFGPAQLAQGNSRNFVLCPGGEYDRSPCGTGTSAKLACLAADGKLAPGQTWIQESVVGSRFMASYQAGPDGTILPRVRGRAFVVADSQLLKDPLDPFANGL